LDMTDAERRRDSSLRRIYNISLTEYLAILAAQDFKCCICLKELTGISNALDHDHKTGFIRGILCAYCNHRVLGRLTNWELVQRMADYLHEPPAIRVIGERATPKKSPRKRRPTKSTGKTPTTRRKLSD
jgi:DNA-directed RNA polymerase subunit RPC12/RpoP